MPARRLRAVLGVEEAAKRVDAAHDHQKVVLTAESEHRVDQIVPRALIAQIDLEAVGEEIEQDSVRPASILTFTSPGQRPRDS